jgi:hypothetical protein
VTPNCVKGLWKKLWPEACTNLEEVGQKTIIHKIVELVNEAGLEDVNEDDFENCRDPMARVFPVTSFEN